MLWLYFVDGSLGLIDCLSQIWDKKRWDKKRSLIELYVCGVIRRINEAASNEVFPEAYDIQIGVSIFPHAEGAMECFTVYGNDKGWHSEGFTNSSCFEISIPLAQYQCFRVLEKMFHLFVSCLTWIFFLIPKVQVLKILFWMYLRWNRTSLLKKIGIFQISNFKVINVQFLWICCTGSRCLSSKLGCRDVVEIFYFLLLILIARKIWYFIPVGASIMILIIVWNNSYSRVSAFWNLLLLSRMISNMTSSMPFYVIHDFRICNLLLCCIS